MIHFPVAIDGVYYENTKIAHKAVFLPKNISYFRLSRALKKGLPELEGIRIERVQRRYELSEPEDPDGDEADLIPVPASESLKKERKRGEPLIRFPFFESPLDRGLPQIQH